MLRFHGDNRNGMHSPMPLFSRADVELYYECHGDGAPLLSENPLAFMDCALKFLSER